MRSFAIASALIAVVSAQTQGYHALNRPDMLEDVPACSTFEIKWTPADGYTGPVTFELIGGSSQTTLVPIGDMFGSVDGAVGSYAWDVPCDEGDKAIYGLKIFQEADTSVFQYSMPFHIVSDGTTPSESDSETTASETETTSETETASETATEETETPEPTTYPPANTTMTTMTTSAPNSTITTPKPTVVTSTNLVTEEPTATATEASEPTTAGASRMAGGSIAILAAAAAFFAL